MSNEEKGTKYKILIAEDAPVQGKKLQYVLEKFGYEVVWALDGALAFNELEKHSFSIIISDYQMPNLDGLEFLKKVRSHPKYNKIPLILLTTIEDEMVFLESLEAGANEFLNKPFRPEELKLRVKNLISLYHYQIVLDEDNKELTMKVHEQNELLKKHLSELQSAHDELKTMQEQLIVNSKMASLGVMSAGVAHEINNPLHIIKMYNLKLKHFLEDQDTDRDRLINSIEQIDKNAERINKIVTHLKQFSQTENMSNGPESKIVNLANCLSDLKDFYGGLISKYEIKLNTKYEENLFANASQALLEQVIINLIHNAVDAVCMIPESEKRQIYLRLYSENDYSFIEVEDNGPGINEDIKEKIFDPFFTTKEPGKGTGLGLSLVRSYLKNINADLDFESTPGKTIFKLKLRKNHE